MEFEEINETVFLFTDKSFYDVVAGALVLPNKLVMIDSGINLVKMKEFRSWVENKTGKKFEILIPTHFHGDHTYGNQIFNDCKIYSTEIHLEYMKMLQEWLTEDNLEREKTRLEDPKALDGLKITLPNEIFEQQIVLVDDDVEIIVKHTGGHTSDSTYIYCPNYKVLFTGDNLFVNSYPYGGHSSCNPDIWIDVYKEFLSLNVEKIIPGHGTVTDKEYVKKSLEIFEEIRKTMKNLSSKGKKKDHIVDYCYKKYFPPKEDDKSGDEDFSIGTMKRWYDFWIEGKK